MTDNKNPKDDGRDWSATLNLPKTEFPMRAGLPNKEPEIIARWDKMGLYKKLREQSRAREKYILHDGPPYANGHLHIGHALNKILKDMINRSFQMRGFDANYVPGWDCHGLPIEWKIEEQYRAKGKDKDEVPINEFRKECRDFADHWIGVQAEEFRRLGVEGDFENPYKTMNFDSEAIIASELHKFAMSGQLYRGSKPIMWSVVERTALAEAEVEYHEVESDTVWVKFPVIGEIKFFQEKDYLREAFSTESAAIRAAEIAQQTTKLSSAEDVSVIIWTTTPWTIPGNRAISFSDRIQYELHEVTETTLDYGPNVGEKYVIAKQLVEETAEKAKLTLTLVGHVAAGDLAAITCAHPLKGLGGGYDFTVPLIESDHVTDEAGTGFVHTAPGHGREDFEAWNAKASELEERGISSQIPFTVDDAGYFTNDAPGFGPDREGGAARVLDDKGKKGDANQAVITALIESNNLFARGRIKHDYPHSWRSKKPIIFRNTPQWFVYMDREITISPLAGEMSAQQTEGGKATSSEFAAIPPSVTNVTSPPQGGRLEGDTLRTRAMQAISDTRFVPSSGQNRLNGMIETRPDWVLSRQRAWGVPIAIFADEDGNILKDEAINARIIEAFENEGADAWYAEGAKERFLGPDHDAAKWQQVTDILDVWFDSGSTHAFCLEQRDDLQWPADLYLEGSDQHRGWFHSSLLESCGTRGRAPYKAVLTHGFTVTKEGKKMSKSLGNDIAPQEIIKQYGADILRVWVASVDFTEDQRFGNEVIKTSVDAYRKMRNTLRWMLGTLGHDKGEKVDFADMPELERLMLHRLVELDEIVRKGYDDFDFKRIFSQLFNFMTVEMSAFYFDIRKDALYCDAPSSLHRKAALQIVGILFENITKWMAPMLPFTMEECWQSCDEKADSIHMEQFNEIPGEWRDDELAEKWRKIRRVRRVVTGALEIERREKRIGSSLEAAPVVYIDDGELTGALEGQDFAEICITSQIAIKTGKPPKDAFKLEEVGNVGVVPALATGNKCARSWRILPEVGSDPDYPELSVRDAATMREIEKAS